MTARPGRAIAVALLLAPAGCIPVLPGAARPGGSRRPERALREGPALASKPVHGKTEPNVLVARDGTKCVVSREKFEKTIIGTSVWCAWTDLDR